MKNYKNRKSPEFTRHSSLVTLKSRELLVAKNYWFLGTSNFQGKKLVTNDQQFLAAGTTNSPPQLKETAARENSPIRPLLGSSPTSPPQKT